MEQLATQTLGITGIKSEKNVRLGTGLGFRNSSQAQRALNKNNLPQSDQNFTNGGVQFQQHPQSHHQMFSQSNNNYFMGSNSPVTNLIASQQMQNGECPQNNQMSASQTQQGFFRRKINLKMSTTNLKAFLNKQPSDNPLIIKSAKNHIINSHLSQGNIQSYSNGVPLSQQGNFFSSQQSLPSPSIQNSSNAPSPQTYNSVINSMNHGSSVNSSSTFQNIMNGGISNNSNIDSRRSINYNANEQIGKQIGNFKSGEIVSVSAFNRGKRFSHQPSKNSSLIKLQNENILIKKKKTDEQLDQVENKEMEDTNEDYYAMRNNSMTKNTIANYSHNTESTNATAQISHHNYPGTTNTNNNNHHHHFFDAQKVKSKQSFSTSQTHIPSSSSQTNIPTLYVKKKITEAKQYSNQVRQQIFEKQDQEEEENFLELCETLQKINYD